jgi:hypothetical protein
LATGSDKRSIALRVAAGLFGLGALYFGSGPLRDYADVTTLRPLVLNIAMGAAGAAVVGWIVLYVRRFLAHQPIAFRTLLTWTLTGVAAVPILNASDLGVTAREFLQLGLLVVRGLALVLGTRVVIDAVLGTLPNFHPWGAVDVEDAVEEEKSANWTSDAANHRVDAWPTASPGAEAVALGAVRKEGRASRS